MCDSSSATRIVFSVMLSPATLDDFGFWIADFGFAFNPKFAIQNPRSSLTQIQFEPERAALPGRALHEDLPAVHGFDNVLHERQAQTRALGHPVVRFDPVKLIEHKRQVL